MITGDNFAPSWREVTEHHHLVNFVPTWHEVPAALFKIRLDLIALLLPLMYDDSAGDTQTPKGADTMTQNSETVTCSLKPMITEYGLNYVLVGDYYSPLLMLPEENRSIGYWGRKHLEYIYEQNQAQALRDAVPSPLGLISAEQSFSLSKLIASVAYMAVDSVTSYQTSSAQADMQYLQDGWALDDAQMLALLNEPERMDTPELFAASYTAHAKRILEILSRHVPYLLQEEAFFYMVFSDYSGRRSGGLFYVIYIYRT